jgi:hypothetical protein
LALSLKESNSGRNSLVDVRQQTGPCHDAHRSRVKIIID